MPLLTDADVGLGVAAQPAAPKAVLSDADVGLAPEVSFQNRTAHPGQEPGGWDVPAEVTTNVYPQVQSLAASMQPQEGVMHKIGEGVSSVINPFVQMWDQKAMAERSQGRAMHEFTPWEAGKSVLLSDEDVGLLKTGVGMISRAQGNPDILSDVQEGIVGGVAKSVQGLTTPEGLAIAPALTTPVGLGAFTVKQVADLPESLEQTLKVLKDPKATAADKTEAVTLAAVNLGTIVAPAAHFAKGLEVGGGMEGVRVKEASQAKASTPASQTGLVSVGDALDAALDLRKPPTGEEKTAPIQPPTQGEKAQVDAGSKMPIAAPEMARPAILPASAHQSGASFPQAPISEANPNAPRKALDPNLQVTVQSPMKMTSGETVPGYVQFDDISEGKNKWSKGPEKLKEEGFEVPDLSKLPQGKYRLGDLKTTPTVEAVGEAKTLVGAEELRKQAEAKGGDVGDAARDVVQKEKLKQFLSVPKGIPGVAQEKYPGGKAITYTEPGKRIRVVNLETDVAERGKGKASAFLQDLKKRGLPIELDIREPGLKSFYEKNGFKEGARKGTMEWKPKQGIVGGFEEGKKWTKESGAISLPDWEWLKKGEKEKRGGFALDAPLVLMDAKVSGFVKSGRPTAEQMMGRLENMGKKGEVSPSELAVYKEQGLEEFLKTRPTVEETAKWMQENGPRVEVRKFGEGGRTPEQVEANTLQHTLDTSIRNPELLDRYMSYIKKGEDLDPKQYGLSEEQDKQIRRLVELNKVTMGQPLGDNAHWSFVAPKAEKDMTGYVEVAVRRPGKQIQDPYEMGGASKEEVKFPSSHSFPPNTLGFGRGYMETLPDGRKVFHVVEVQSDWAQDVRQFSNQYPNAHIWQNPKDNMWEVHGDSRHIEASMMENGFNTKEQAQKSLDERYNKTQRNDPLLAHHETLVLKSLIQHAREQGADAIAVSDAETAMMTEGHNRNATSTLIIRPDQVDQAFRDGWYVSREDTRLYGNANMIKEAQAKYGGVIEVAQPSQAPGMRLHYDRILPDILERLTGKKGEKVGFGEHKKAFDKAPGEVGSGSPRKDLIFREPSGELKTSITARVYPLPSPDELPHSLMGKNKPKVTLEKEAPPSSVLKKNETGEQPKGITPRINPRAGESGSVPLDPLNIAKFVESDIKPLVKKGTDALRALKDGVARLVAPTTLVDVKDLDVLMEARGRGEEFQTKAASFVKSAKDYMSKMDEASQVAFMDRMKRGQTQPTLDLQKIADLLRTVDDKVYTAVSAYKPGLPYLDHHLRAIWKVIPGSKDKGLTEGSIGSKRPWQGSQGAFRKHTLEDVTEGLKAGGKLVTTNPVELVLLNAQDGMKFVVANRAWEGWKASGTAQFVKSGEKAPPGYVKLKDTIAEVYFPTDKGMVKSGEYWVQEDAARVLNNYLSRDRIRESDLGQGLLALKNTTTAIELSLSPFHAFFEGLESAQSSFGLATAKLFRGEVSPSAFAKTAHSFVTDTKLGGMFKRVIEDEAEFRSSDPEGYAWFTKNYPSFRAVVKDAFDSGMKITMHEDFKTKFREGFKHAVAEDNYLGALWRALPALNEFPMEALFDKYIPRLKMGMFLREYTHNLDLFSKDILSGKKTKGQVGRETWNFIEDRFGEMNFDNLYWNRTSKSFMQLLMRSITWKLGTARAYGRAGKDFVKMFEDVAKGEKPKMTLPMTWLVGQVFVNATIASVITKATTGKYPWDLAQNKEGKEDGVELARNLMFPRVDEKDSKQRVSLPTYLSKDVSHLVHSPSSYIASGLSGFISRSYEDWNNKDFYGTQVRNENDPVYKQALDTVKHLIPLPIGVSQFEENRRKGQTVGQAAQSFLLPPAPAYESRSSAENEAAKIWASKAGQGGRTKEQEEKHNKELQAVGEIRRGEEDSHEAVAKGELTKESRKRVDFKANHSMVEYAAKEMGVEDALKVYTKATQDERETMKPILHKKIVHDSRLKIVDKQRYLQVLEEPVKKETKKNATKFAPDEYEP